MYILIFSTYFNLIYYLVIFMLFLKLYFSDKNYYHVIMRRQLIILRINYYIGQSFYFRF